MSCLGGVPRRSTKVELLAWAELCTVGLPKELAAVHLAHVAAAAADTSLTFRDQLLVSPDQFDVFCARACSTAQHVKGGTEKSMSPAHGCLEPVILQLACKDYTLTVHSAAYT